MKINSGRFKTTHGSQFHVQEREVRASRIGVRPERIQLSSAPISGLNAVTGQVDAVTYLGSQIEVKVRLDDGLNIQCRMPNSRSASGLDLSSKPRVHACFSPDDAVVFSE